MALVTDNNVEISPPTLESSRQYNCVPTDRVTVGLGLTYVKILPFCLALILTLFLPVQSISHQRMISVGESLNNDQFSVDVDMPIQMVMLPLYTSVSKCIFSCNGGRDGTVLMFVTMRSNLNTLRSQFTKTKTKCCLSKDKVKGDKFYIKRLYNLILKYIAFCSYQQLLCLQIDIIFYVLLL